MRRIAAAALCALASAAISACAGGSTTTAARARPGHHGGSTQRAPAGGHGRKSRPRPAAVVPAYPRLLTAALGSSPTNFVPAVSWRGQTAVWVARRPNLALLSFRPALTELRLHSGTLDAGATGWRFGPAIAGWEKRRLIAALNGGFRLNIGAGGFEAYGRVGSALRDGLGSIVTYTDGSTDIRAWHEGVPAPGKQVASVRQNLHLLITGGRPAGNLGCLLCWGATLGGVEDPARSALGITRDGHLVWAGGEHLTVQTLADALLGARAVRAVELDINPEWVAGYLYGHRGGKGPLAPVPVAPGQPGVPGQFLKPYSRDFFTIVAR
jgi:hypothetical protein